MVIGPYIDNSVDVEIAALSSWPRWLSIDGMDDDAAVVAVARRVLSANCNDGVPPPKVADLVKAMLPSDATLHLWLYTERKHREQILDELSARAIVAYSPYDLRRIGPTSRPDLSDNSLEGLAEAVAGLVTSQSPQGSAAHLVKRVIEFHPDPSPEELLQERPGMAILSCSGSELSRIGLPDSFLTFCAWDDDRIGLMPRSGSAEDLLCKWPSYTDILSNYEMAVVPGGEHGSDLIIASTVLDAQALVARVEKAMQSLAWRYRSFGIIDGAGCEELYERSLQGERLPPSAIDLGIDLNDGDGI